MVVFGRAVRGAAASAAGVDEHGRHEGVDGGERDGRVRSGFLRRESTGLETVVAQVVFAGAATVHQAPRLVDALFGCTCRRKRSTESTHDK